MLLPAEAGQRQEWMMIKPNKVSLDELLNHIPDFNNMIATGHELQKKLGLDADFMKVSVDLDDWSFVLRCHAVLEAAINDLVLKKCLHPDLMTDETRAGLVKYVEKMNLSAKLELIDKAELLRKPALNYIRSLTALRNAFAHNPRNTMKPLRSMIDEMDEGARKHLHFHTIMDTVPDDKLLRTIASITSLLVLAVIDEALMGLTGKPTN